MTANNDITNDRITNATKGDKQKYRDNWDRIFGKGKEHVQPNTGDVEMGGLKVYTVMSHVDTFFVTENAKKALEKAKEAPSPAWVIENHVNSFPNVEVIYQNVGDFQEEYKLY